MQQKRRRHHLPQEFYTLVLYLDQCTRSNHESMHLETLELIAEFLLPDSRFGCLQFKLCQKTGKLVYWLDLWDGNTTQMINRYTIQIPEECEKWTTHTPMTFSIACSEVQGQLVLPIGILLSDPQHRVHVLTCPVDSTDFIRTTVLLSPRENSERGWLYPYGFMTEEKLLIMYLDQQQTTYIWSFQEPEPKCLAYVEDGYAWSFGLLLNPLRLVIPSRHGAINDYSTAVYDLTSLLSENSGETKRLTLKNSASHFGWKKLVSILEDGTIACRNRGILLFYREKNEQQRHQFLVEQRKKWMLNWIQTNVIDPILSEFAGDPLIPIIPSPPAVPLPGPPGPPIPVAPPPPPIVIPPAPAPAPGPAAVVPILLNHPFMFPANFNFEKENFPDMTEPASPIAMVSFLEENVPAAHYQKIKVCRSDGTLFSIYPTTNLFQMTNGSVVVPERTSANSVNACIQVINENRQTHDFAVTEVQLPVPQGRFTATIAIPGNRLVIFTTLGEVVIFDIVSKKWKSIRYETSAPVQTLYTFPCEPPCWNSRPFLQQFEFL
jgi:hypothetical protein